MPRIGQMRHRLDVEARSVAPDEAGGETVTWAVAATVWAQIVPLAGFEALRKDRLAGTVTHRITVRFREDIAPEMRFRMGARIFQITTVRDVDERRRWLTCDCEEKNL